jgi:cell division protein FtsQ
VVPFPRRASLPGIARPARVADLLPSGKAIVCGFALLAAAALLYLGARATSVFAVRSIEVDGAPPRVAAHVRAALRPLEGKSLLTVHAADVVRRLERLPDVASASYDRDFPHTLRLRIAPAHTIAVLRRGPSAWVVASDGRVVRSSGRGAAPRLPRIWLPRAADVATGRTIDEEDATTAIAALSTARRSGFASRVLTVRSNEHELTFVLENHLELRFGDATDLPVKLVVARRILPQAQSYDYLDVSAPDRPVVGGHSQLSG